MAMPRRIYLDHNATSPLRPEARAAMLAAMEQAGNPSSVHQEGRAARRVVETARAQVATLVGATSDAVIFTSGGTEANNLMLSAGWDVIITSTTEHDAILAPARIMAETRGTQLLFLPVDATGVVRIEVLDRLLEALGPTPGRVLISVHAANNETGVLQPLDQMVARVSAYRATLPSAEHSVLLHSDAVQVAGRAALDFNASGLDTMTVSAHKMGGPKGVGALVVRPARQPLAVSGARGGGQERRQRGGTENVVGIAGFGAAAEAARTDLTDVARVEARRARLESGLVAASHGNNQIEVIGATAPRLANTTSVVRPGHTSETQIIALDLAGIAVSAGAACSSGKVVQSPVLTAMGRDDATAGAALRISQGWSTTDDDIDGFLTTWARLVGTERRAVPA